MIEAEFELISKNIVSVIQGNYKTYKPETEGNVYLKKDFNDLREIDFDKVKTSREFYDRIRALSHGSFRNAFIVDKESGKKYYIKLVITSENEIESKNIGLHNNI